MDGEELDGEELDGDAVVVAEWKNHQSSSSLMASSHVGSLWASCLMCLCYRL